MHEQHSIDAGYSMLTGDRVFMVFSHRVWVDGRLSHSWEIKHIEEKGYRLVAW